MKDKFVTTAIAYTNGAPHIGHLYESIIADFIVRYLRLKGHTVHFLTGTDEHGLKISKTSQSRGIQPIELCNQNVALFQELYTLFDIEYDWFVRTTFPEHEKLSQDVFRTLRDKDLIYKGQYSGWYDTREEAYLTETDLKKIPPEHLGHTRYVKLEEPCYFFRLSKFQDQILKYLEKATCFDANSKNHVLARLKSPLKDLSITRTRKSLDWGIPVPDDDEHVMYVWFEALLNYLTGKQHLGLEDTQEMIHVIGKDITWFHQVIWIAMLIALEKPLPEAYYVHGFILDASKVKMSKSLGNSFNPSNLVKKKGLHSDLIRAYLLNHLHFGSDFGFNEIEMEKFNNGILADQVGNLIARVLNLGNRYCQDEVIEYQTERDDITFPSSSFEIPDLESYSEKVYQIFRELNKWLTENEPWIVAKVDLEKGQWMILNSLNYVYKACHLLEPIMPKKAEEIYSKFDHGKTSYQTDLPVGTKFEKKIILFKKFH